MYAVHISLGPLSTLSTHLPLHFLNINVFLDSRQDHKFIPLFPTCATCPAHFILLDSVQITHFLVKQFPPLPPHVFILLQVKSLSSAASSQTPSVSGWPIVCGHASIPRTTTSRSQSPMSHYRFLSVRVRSRYSHVAYVLRNVQTGCGVHPASYWLFLLVVGGRGVKLTTRFHLVP
jgi:hypothetical protein